MWGPYRSNLYIGMRPRIPDSLMTGLFWYNLDNFDSIIKAKHMCDQNDDFKKFGWTKFDPRYGGIEEIKDNENHIDLTFEFVKSYNLKNELDQSWGLRVKGVPQKGHEAVKTSMVLYAGLEILNPVTGEKLTLANAKTPKGFEHDEIVVLEGISKDFAKFKLEINDGPDTNRHVTVDQSFVPGENYDPKYTKHIGLNVPEHNIWRAKQVFVSMIQESLQTLNKQYTAGELDVDLEKTPAVVGLTLPDLHAYDGNMHFIQKNFEGAFEFDIVFNTQNTEKPIARAAGYDEVTFENLGEKIDITVSKFNDKFHKIFKFNSPFNLQKYKAFGEDFISNLIGGVGYFFGDHLVDRTTEIDEEGDDEQGKFKQLDGKPEGPFELFTSVPSRPFFPRGFYWDEGFHLIPILEYDFDLALEILKSWFDLIDDDGWIAREQILGEEARSKVPEEFQVQNPNIANPPTLMLVFLNVIKKANEQKKVYEQKSILVILMYLKMF